MLQRICVLLTALALILGTLAVPVPAHTEPALSAGIIINEIHYDPSPRSPLHEYVELHNPTGSRVDLSSWTLDGGIHFTFPLGSSVAAGGYVVIAIDPPTMQASYGVNALGPFAGRLSNDEDRLILRDSQANVVDEVSYRVSFPWPVTGAGAEQSIGLVAPQLDNAVGGAWRAGSPSPGRANALLLANPPPFVHDVTHTPSSPTSRDTVRVAAQVTDGDGVAAVTLWVQVVTPGNYIRIFDPAYATQWTAYPMQAAGNDVYVATLPAEIVRHRNLLRYRIEARDGGGRSVTVPYSGDPQPNFALFVYDGVPVWVGAINPREPGPLGQLAGYDFNNMGKLPVYHFIANPADVADAQFIPPSTFTSGYMGSDYLWRGTLVYNGVVYDHIGFRARGQAFRYGAGKNKWKFNFWPGHRFQAYDNDGRPYPERWDKLNLTGGFQHANRGYRGEHGLFEALSMRLFAMAGVPAPATHFVHFRVVDQAVEQGPGQYEGDFWGLYMAVEEVDGHFLDAHNLPDGNLYKMKDWTGELNNQGLRQPADKSDLNGFIGTYTYTSPSPSWWEAVFDLEGYYRFRSVLEAVHHYDVDEGKNYFYFNNPETGRWSILPWDTDLTWALSFFGQGNEPFRDHVLTNPTFQVAYQNHLREIRDLLFNPEQVSLLVDEYAALIDTPAGGLSMVDADRALWDYHPILVSRYVEERRAGWGKFYLQSPARDFAGMVQLMKEWAVSRSAWIDVTLLTDREMPATPTVQYAGPAGYPADQLVFRPSAFSDPQGAGSFGAIQWRAAAVSWPGLPGHVPGTPNRYEIDSAWTSAPMAAYTSSYAIPQGVCQPGVVCRVRVRMQDNSGRWSHWSAPIQFVTGAPSLAPTRDLRITEIMYHPAPAGNVAEEDLEFVELKNVGDRQLDLSFMRFSEGIEYTFAPGTRLEPGAFLVIARNPTQFTAHYGFAPFAGFDKGLSNKGETLALEDAFGRSVLTFAYGDDGGWPDAADGRGYSLVPANARVPGDAANPASWRASTSPGGSPGSDDPVAVLVNELLFDPDTMEFQAVEIFNPHAVDADIGGWFLLDTPLDGLARYAQNSRLSTLGVRVPANIVVPANGYLVLTAGQLARALRFHNGQGALFLVAAGPAVLSGYQHGFQFMTPASSTSLGRHVAGDTREHFTAQRAASLGAANSGPQVGPLIIERLRVDASDGTEWIEVVNHGAEPVLLYDPANPSLTWLLSGVGFQFPSGLEIKPGQRLLITNVEPGQLCSQQITSQSWQVTGPYARQLPEERGEVHLLKPRLAGSAKALLYEVVDSVLYDASLVAPSPPGVDGWARVTPDAFGQDPLNWVPDDGALFEDELGAQAGGPLCSFDAVRRSSTEVSLSWTAHAGTTEGEFELWRNDTFHMDEAKRVAQGIPGETIGVVTRYDWTDATVNSGDNWVYWLKVKGGDSSTPIALTTLRKPYSLQFLPLLRR